MKVNKLAKDNVVPENRVKDSITQSLNLSEQETEKLLTQDSDLKKFPNIKTKLNNKKNTHLE